MVDSMDALATLNREFLELRAQILQIGATLDRIERQPGSVEGDPRLPQIREALEVLLQSHANRAEQIQLIFSRPYDQAWRETYFSTGKP